MSAPLRTKPRLFTLLALLMAASPVLGGDIYRWVDEDGVTNFSHTPPEDPALATRVPHLDNLSTTPPVDVAALLETAASLEASRLAREQARATQRQAVGVEPPRAETVPRVTHHPVLAHPVPRKHPLLHVPHLPIEKRPGRRPPQPEPVERMDSAVASGPPAQRPAREAFNPWKGDRPSDRNHWQR
jgi:hypothetical protein